MREQIQFPDYDPLLPDSTLYGNEYQARFGQFVLQSEAASLGAVYDKAKHDANVDFLDAHQGGWAEAPNSDIAKGWSLAHYGMQDPVAAKHSAQQFLAETHTRAEAAERSVRGSIAALRSYIGGLSGPEKQKLDQNIDIRLTQYAQEQGTDPKDLAFTSWKSQEEKEAGKPLTWVDWLSRSPAQAADGDMQDKDRQLLNFVQWNQHVFNTMNSDPHLRAEFEDHTLNLQDALHEAVEEGILDQKLYENMLQKPVIATIGEPMDIGLLNAHGYTRQGVPEIILPQEYSVDTFNHEMIHQYGGFPDKFWNESAVQLIADEIDGIQGAPLHESAYETGMKAMRDMLKLAHMGPDTLSKFYANRDYEGLVDELYERTAIDFGQMYQDMKQQAMAAYPKDQIMGEGYLAHLMSEAVEDTINTY
jgi:hypothetical protein